MADEFLRLGNNVVRMDAIAYITLLDDGGLKLSLKNGEVITIDAKNAQAARQYFERPNFSKDLRPGQWPTKGGERGR